MHYLFEQSDVLNTPVECFVFDTANEVFPVKPHWHYFIEIIYMINGTAEMHAERDTYIMNAGDMILFHPRSVHSIYSLSNDDIKYAVLKFDINTLSTTSSYAPKLRSIFKSAQRKKMPVYFPADKTVGMDCERIFLSCTDEMQKQNYGFDLIIKAKLYELLVGIIRSWQEKGFAIDNDAWADETHYDIDSITEYIDAHMGENLQVVDVAKECRLSYSCFAKKFQALYGMSCKEYIEMMRVYKVEELLLFTDFNLNYISQETGFSDCSHMIKSFKTHRGITPKQFRLKNKAVG